MNHSKHSSLFTLLLLFSFSVGSTYQCYADGAATMQPDNNFSEVSSNGVRTTIKITQSNIISAALGTFIGAFAATAIPHAINILKKIISGKNIKKETLPVDRKVAIIELYGEINRSSEKRIIKALKRIENNTEISALIIRIDSGGGSITSAEEIRSMIQRVEESKPVLIFVENYCCSAAYFIASPFYIIARSMSDVGSIGVYTSIRKHEIRNFETDQCSGEAKFYTITSGKYKGMYDIDAPMTEDQIKYEQEEIINRTANLFKDQVALDRGITQVEVNELGQGQAFVGAQALELGLINQTGVFYDALQKIRQLLEASGKSVKELIEVENF